MYGGGERLGFTYANHALYGFITPRDVATRYTKAVATHKHEYTLHALYSVMKLLLLLLILSHTIVFKSLSTDINTSWEGRQVKVVICKLR